MVADQCKHVTTGQNTSIRRNVVWIHATACEAIIAGFILGRMYPWPDVSLAWMSLTVRTLSVAVLKLCLIQETTIELELASYML